MSELVAWLNAQLDADEAAARAVPGERWPGETFDVRFDSWESDHSDADREFVRRFDPARVLVEVEAKRAIVAGLVDAEAVVERIGPDLDKPGDQAEWFNYHAWRQAVELLALPYADRPGFDETWRP